MQHLHLLITVHLLLLLSSLSLVLQAKAANNGPDDLSALLSFKSQISGDPFGALASWNSSLNYCKWQGVTCGRRHPDRVTALVLDSANLTGRISPSLANLTFLHRLSLHDNQLTQSIPQELGYLNRLRFLNLSMNLLEGNILSALANCSNLEYLFLEDNNLQGNIPSNFAQCRSLKYLHLGTNSLSGGIPPELGLLSNLVFVALSQNNLIGNIPHTLGNLTNLHMLYLEQNSFSGFIPTSLGQLQSLQYFYIFANNISGNIPHSLFNLSSMVNLDIDTNQLKGTLPFDMCDAFENLENLFLFENQLTGQIPVSISNCSALVAIDFSYNKLTGTIPSSIGTLKNLYFINFSQNQLEAKTTNDWSFMDALSNCTNLQQLVIGANQLQGNIPSAIGNLSSYLQVLLLSLNPISGSIPLGIGKLTNLNFLALSDTLLTGTIPKEIGALGKLQYLGLESNKMSGEIPSAFGNLTMINELYLNNNAFEGSIPVELSNMQALELLDLSNNKLTGTIPKEIMNVSSLSIGIDLSGNYLSGLIPSEIGKLKNLGIMHFSHNKLSGEIPSTIVGCQVLQALSLDSNLLRGAIPSSFSNLKGLQRLDISTNSFSGQLPEFLENMDLEYLNLSFNNFEGELPKEGIFKNISSIDIRGNPKLCGGSPELDIPKCILDTPTQKNHSRKTIIILLSIAGFCMCLIIAVTSLLVTRYLRRRSQNEPQHVISGRSSLKIVSYNDILKATDRFSLENLIGRGSFGAVYKAVMSFENVRTTVAVKVLNLEHHGASRSFLSECEALRSIRHRNLIKVLSSCSGIDNQGNDFKALVFEFMPNGSLEAWLHPNACTNRPFKSLDLIQRLNIAIDVAEALDYLHHYGPTLIVHCDLKPSNVLLDDDMTAHVSDFGLAKILVGPDDTPLHSTTGTGGIKGSIGYIPPEYGVGGQASVEGDVYSYGVLLLEMFTGVSPTNERFRDGISLNKHVEMAFPDQVMDTIDSKLFSDNDQGETAYSTKNVYNCLVSVIQCGLLCSKELPKERIGMKEVAKELNSARGKLLS